MSTTRTASDAVVYLDCAATAPIEPRVRDLVLRYLDEEFGNAGSRTHDYGAHAKQAAQQARDEVAALAGLAREDVVFTSGATESNNLAILGLAEHGRHTGKRHIITTAIEHKAVLEPVHRLESEGIAVTVLPCCGDGTVDPAAIADALRADTLLVSVMQVNNETGIIQPVAAIAEALADHEAYLHVDAAQGFGKELDELRNERIDMISVSGHKLYAPKGVGALLMRRRGYRRPPLTPLMVGGGQERGLRPGTLPVHLVVGFGEAARLARVEQEQRQTANRRFREAMLAALAPLEPEWNGNIEKTVGTTLNCSFPGIDSEALMVSLRPQVAISNGSACTSHKYEPSHVLTAMGFDEDRISGAVRWSWCHMTVEPDWDAITSTIASLR